MAMFEDTTITLGHDDAASLALLLCRLEDWLAHSAGGVVEDLVAFLEPKFRHGIWPARMQAEAIVHNLGHYGRQLHEAVGLAEDRAA
jgi:hypothetical protein